MSKLRLSIGLCLLLGLAAKAPAVRAQEVNMRQLRINVDRFLSRHSLMKQVWKKGN